VKVAQDKKMKKLLIVLCCLLAIACSKTPHQVDDAKEPPFTLLDGQTVHLNDYRGKWVYINYWAAWCHPCVEEIPMLNELYAENKDKLVVLAINYDLPDKAALAKMVKDVGIRYPSLLEDPKKRLGVDMIEGLPVTIVINPEGQVIKKMVGEQKKERLLAIMNDKKG